MAAELIIVIIGILSGAFAGRLRVRQATTKRQRNLSEEELAAERTRRMLESCRARGSSVMLVDIATGNASPARFVDLDDGAIKFETTGEGGDQECWSRHALIAVQFNLEGMSRVFVAAIEEASPGTAGHTHVTTTIPHQVADGETRAAFRVSLNGDEGITATVLCGQADFSATVTDVSTTGAGLACEPEAVAGMKVGAEVEVMFELAGTTVQRTGHIRKLRGTQLGVSFPVWADDDPPREQEAYFDVIRELLDRDAA